MEDTIKHCVVKRSQDSLTKESPGQVAPQRRGARQSSQRHATVCLER
jgi:hypothetical protein